MKMEKYTELEEMKAQLALLNKKLEKETIVNERLIRRAMKNKAWGIRRKIIAEIILCFLMIPFFIWLMPAVVGLSMGFCYYGAFFMLLALVFDGYLYKNFRPEDFLLGNLLEARKNTLKLKRLCSSWLIFGIPYAVGFFSWFVYDMSQVYQGEDLRGQITAGVVGGVIGGIVGTFQYRKIQRTADEILQQIEDISSDCDSE